jgi:hypothetical protein
VGHHPTPSLASAWKDAKAPCLWTSDSHPSELVSSIPHLADGGDVRSLLLPGLMISWTHDERELEGGLEVDGLWAAGELGASSVELEPYQITGTLNPTRSGLVLSHVDHAVSVIDSGGASQR